MTKTNKYRAVLFGLNYEGTNGELRGCVNDVNNVSKFLTEKMGFDCNVYSTDKSTTAIAMIQRLYELALESRIKKLKYVWIHYSGHGTYAVDKSKDELDGYDECLVPSDFYLIPDDTIQRIFKLFYKRTKIIFIADCCHSGTIGDLTYSWDTNISKKENDNIFKSKVVSISGCLDSQYSADAYLPDINDPNKYKFSGAMTTYLLDCFYNEDTNNIFDIVKSLQEKLKRDEFVQIPRLTSSYDLNVNNTLFPIGRFNNRYKRKSKKESSSIC